MASAQDSSVTNPLIHFPREAALTASHAESSMLTYRKDLFDARGLTMPEQPTYDDIVKFAAALTDNSKGIYGITLRGKPGWGENMAFVDTLLNTFGVTWFDMNWKPTIDTPEWKKAITFYVNLMKTDGPPGASSNGFNENLTLFGGGRAAMWIDATSDAGPLFDKDQSQGLIKSHSLLHRWQSRPTVRIGFGPGR